MRAGTVSAGHPVNVATGAVFSTHGDFAVPGKIRLYWERRYDTAQLGAPSGALGPGWSARYFATLTREGNEYRFVLPEGGIEMFVDHDGTVDRGGIVRNLGTFQELSRLSGEYVITRWGPAGQAPERLVFAARGGQAIMPLVRIENGSGAALDMVYDSDGRVFLVRQRLERRALQLTYMRNGHVGAVALVSADGASQIVARYEYDRDGRLVTAVNALGNADRYEYDAQGRLVREIRKDGTVYSFRYDKQGRCIRTSGLDRYDEKTFRYLDAAGWTEVTDSRGSTTRYQWLPSGQVITVVDPLGGEEKTEYDELGRITATVMPSGETTRYRYDQRGNRIEIIDPAGESWKDTVDAAHRRIASTDPMGRTTRWHYDDQGHMTAVELPGGARFEYRWDAAGNLREVTTRRGTFRRFNYDARGTLIETIDPAGHAARYAVDALGRMVESVNASGNRYRVEYDLLGRTTLIQYPDGSTETFVYDAAGNQTSATDRNGNARFYRWGPCQRLLEATGANGGTVRYVWGTEPSLLEAVINEKGETLRFVHDSLGRFIQQVSFDGRERSFKYDASGRVIQIENGAGEILRFVWDSCGRLIERHLPDGEIHRLTYDASGGAVSAETPDRLVRFERDAAGRVTREVQGDHLVESAYDPDGNRVRIRTDLGHGVEFGIDASLQVDRLTLTTGDAFGFTFNEVGREASRLLPGGLQLISEYDSSGRVNLHHLATGQDPQLLPGAGRPDGRAILERSYSYAPNGTVLAVRDSRRGASEYSYDPEQHITRAAHGGQTTETFEYDPAGNLTEITVLPVREELRYAAGSRLERCSETRYEFDGEGRLVKRIEPIANGKSAEWQFTWDALSQLRSVRRPDGEEWRYAYDFYGRRFAKRGTKSETTFVWDRDVIVHEVLTRGPTTSWVYEDSRPEPIAQVVDGKVFSVVCDQLGTPQELITRTGAIAWSARSSVWGRDLGHEARGADCPIRFPGQWADSESGLHYNRFRYYDPRTGRFISQDPVAPRSTLNFYRYAPNPLNWLDVLGLGVCENRQKGEDFKDGVKGKYPQPPFVVHEEVTIVVTTPNGQVRTRVDLVVQDPSGATHYIETKASPTAPYPPNQSAAGVEPPAGTNVGTLPGTPEMRSDRPGLTPKGQTLPPGTQVTTVRPGDQLPGLPPGTTADPV